MDSSGNRADLGFQEKGLSNSGRAEYTSMTNFQNYSFTPQILEHIYTGGHGETDGPTSPAFLSHKDQVPRGYGDDFLTGDAGRF